MVVHGDAGAGSKRIAPVVPCPLVVGRSRETEVLAAALGTALDGRGACVFVHGEAGIGKSRLVQEIVEVAAGRGARVLRGRAVPGSAGAAFRPFTEALLPVLDDLGSGRAELEGWRSVLSAILPTIPDRAGADRSAPVVGEAVIQVLRAACRPAGGVLVLEDLHWADPETIAIVEHLSDNLHRAPVLCLATVRTEEPGPANDLVARVRARRSSSVLALDRLNDAQVAAMVHHCSGGDGLERATALGEGIPFLIEELLLAPGVPTSFADTVRARLEPLDDAERRVLHTAAAFGRHFDWRLLPAASSVELGGVVDALDRAVDIQLLDIDGDGFRFRHALTADAVLASVSPPRREALARAALDALDASAQVGSPAAVEVAARLAEQAGQRDRAGRLYLELGEDALRRAAIRTAVASLERVVGLLDGGDVRTRANERLVEALALAGRVDDALRIGRRLVADLADDRATAVHLHLASAAMTGARWDDAAIHLEAAGDLLGEGATAQEAAELAAREAELALGTSDLARADRRARDALTAAGREGLIEVECSALQLLGRVARRSSLDEAEEWFMKSLAIAEANDLTMWQQRARYELGTIALLERSEVASLLEAQRLAESLGAMATATVLDIELAAGYAGLHDLDAQVRHATAAVRRGQDLGLDFVVAYGWHFVAAAALLSGDRERAEEAATASRAGAAGSRDIEGLLVGGYELVAAFLDEDRDAARTLTATCTRLLRDSDTAPPMHLRAAWPLLLAVERDPEATAAIEELEHAGLSVSRGARGGLAMARAVVAGWTDPARAASLAREADRLLIFVPWWQHLVRRLAAEAAARDRWSLPNGCLTESEAWFRSHGYHRLAEACARFDGEATAGLPAAWAELGITRREADVLALVIEGLANKEIARTLDLSVRTVEKHVESLLRKAGAKSRTQLARVAATAT